MQPEDEDDRYEVTYEVTISVPENGDGHPDPSEIKRAIYQGIADIDTEDAVEVTQL